MSRRYRRLICLPGAKKKAIFPGDLFSYFEKEGEPITFQQAVKLCIEDIVNFLADTKDEKYRKDPKIQEMRRQVREQLERVQLMDLWYKQTNDPLYKKELEDTTFAIATELHRKYGSVEGTVDARKKSGVSTFYKILLQQFQAKEEAVKDIGTGIKNNRHRPTYPTDVYAIRIIVKTKDKSKKAYEEAVESAFEIANYLPEFVIDELLWAPMNTTGTVGTELNPDIDFTDPRFQIKEEFRRTCKNYMQWQKKVNKYRALHYIFYNPKKPYFAIELQIAVDVDFEKVNTEPTEQLELKSQEKCEPHDAHKNRKYSKVRAIIDPPDPTKFNVAGLECGEDGSIIVDLFGLFIPQFIEVSIKN